MRIFTLMQKTRLLNRFKKCRCDIQTENASFANIVLTLCFDFIIWICKFIFIVATRTSAYFRAEKTFSMFSLFGFCFNNAYWMVSLLYFLCLSEPQLKWKVFNNFVRNRN